MATRSTSPTAPLRAAAVGSTTATLSAAGHALGGGGLPSGAVSVQLALVGLACAGVTLRGAGRFLQLLAVLTVGQVVGHVLSTVSGHHMGPVPGERFAAGDGVTMLAWHAVAVSCAAALIAVGEASCRALSHARKAMTPPASHPVADAAPSPLPRREHPQRSILLLTASLSHRGPPVAVQY